ncbi:MAG: NUDIX domain-containing protein [Candidatus Woesearchaeota archaeon]
MKHIEVSIIAFYDSNNRILLEKRLRSKYSEEWAFFGGVLEPENSNEQGLESKEQGLEREILQELNYAVTNYRHVKSYHIQPADNIKAVEHLFVAEFPGFDKIQFKDSLGGALFTFDEARRLRLMRHHYGHLNDLEKYLKQK